MPAVTSHVATKKTAKSDVAVRRVTLKPQLGPQTTFLHTTADIAVYGGAAGAGKTYALLLEPLRHRGVHDFGAVIFRRTYPQIMNEGGLWDTAGEVYTLMEGAEPRLSRLDWRMPSGCRIGFAHMQHEQDRYKWDGTQIPLIGFDQLEHFSWRSFWYMVGRNRSTCGINPYIRATCNPDPDHWLRSFMEWWIDEHTGFPIPERSGVVRYFLNVDNETYWADDPAELHARFGAHTKPMSFTFVAGKVTDNPALLEKDPEYLAKLEALPKVDRERLLAGNWNIRDSAGMFFRREWFEVVNAAPAGQDTIRYWDRAATASQNGQPVDASWTAGVKMSKTDSGLFYITDVVRFQQAPPFVRKSIKNIAEQDGITVRVGIEQDPAQAGKAEAEDHVRHLAGFNARANTVRESKGLRAKLLSAQVEPGNVKLVRGSWNDAFINEAVNFDGSDKCRSDQVDAASGAFYMLTKGRRAGAWGRKRR